MAFAGTYSHLGQWLECKKDRPGFRGYGDSRWRNFQKIVDNDPLQNTFTHALINTLNYLLIIAPQ